MKTDLTFLRQAEELRELKKRAAHFKDKGAKAAAETASDYTDRLERLIEKLEDERAALIKEIDRMYRERFKFGAPRRGGERIGAVGRRLDHRTCDCYTKGSGAFADTFCAGCLYKIENSIEHRKLVTIRSSRAGEKYVGRVLDGDSTLGTELYTFKVFVLGRIVKKGRRNAAFVKFGEGEDEKENGPFIPPEDAEVFLYEDFFMGDIKSKEDFAEFVKAAEKAHDARKEKKDGPQ